MSLPLLVHVLAHPSSQAGRDYAEHLYRSLNHEPALPGLRVPLLFAREREDHAPPGELERGERTFVVVLADDELNADEAWCSFVADEWQRCKAEPHARLLPVQLSEYAHPLDKRLANVNFPRAWRQEQSERACWVADRVVLELLRFVNDLTPGDQVPLKPFISHTKLDLEPGGVFDTLARYLDGSTPVGRWTDSGEIPGGSNFDDVITDAIRDRAVLVLLTDNYSSRSWCRREVLLAKQYQRPIVVVDALQQLERRSFPYVGNVPVCRWEPGERGAERAINLLIKEALRHEVTRLWLAQARSDHDLLLVSPPELINLSQAQPERAILYPDPVLPDEERLLVEGMLEASGKQVRLETPMQRKVSSGGLEHMIVALSVSESPDLRAAGLSSAHFDDMLVTLSRELLLRGAKLAYGGHLGKDSYTHALFELARAYRTADGIKPVEKVLNYFGWPLRVSVAERSQFDNAATLIEVPRPPGVEALDPKTFGEHPEFFLGDSPERRYAWARGMTAMRERMSQEVSARVIIGAAASPVEGVTLDGARKTKWYTSRIPGVVEEFIVTLEAGLPIYIVGAFGGVGGLLADLLEGREREEMSWEFQRHAPHAEGMRAIYERTGEWRDYTELTRVIRDAGVSGLANGLSEAENQELFRTRDIERATTLIVEGLLRVR